MRIDSVGGEMRTSVFMPRDTGRKRDHQHSRARKRTEPREVAHLNPKGMGDVSRHAEGMIDVPWRERRSERRDEAKDNPFSGLTFHFTEK